jgi:hypothetical protein
VEVETAWPVNGILIDEDRLGKRELNIMTTATKVKVGGFVLVLIILVILSFILTRYVGSPPPPNAPQATDNSQPPNPTATASAPMDAQAAPQVHPVPRSALNTPANQRWHMWSRTMTSYAMAMDASTLHDGHATMLLQSANPPLADGSYAMIDKTDAHPEIWPGRHVRMTIWLKSQDVTVGAGPMIRLWGPNDQLTVRNDHRSIIGTIDWQEYTIETDAPPDSQSLDIGALLYGEGKIWVDLDSVRCDIVP